MAGSRWWFFRRRVLNEAIHRSWDWVQSRGALYPGTVRAERFGSFGENSLLGFPVATLFGESSIHIGVGDTHRQLGDALGGLRAGPARCPGAGAGHR